MTKPKFIEWGTAGLTNDEGQLDRPLENASWPVPLYIRLGGGMLFWEWDTWRGDQLSPTPSSYPGYELLQQFLNLADAPAEQILRYALRYGVLGICEHDLPSSHNPTCKPLSRDPDHHFHYEPIEAWRRFSGEARALLNIAAMLHHGKPGADEDWAAFSAATGRRRPIPRSEHPSGYLPGLDWTSNEVEAVAERVNEWLSMSNIRPHFRWYAVESIPSIRLATETSQHGLFAALAIQLMLAISRADGLAICSACSNSYFPKRRPRVGQRHYCEACGRRAAMRHASAGYRLRKAHREGRQDGDKPAIEIIPEEAAPFIERGMAYLRRGDTDLAVLNLEEAIRRKPNQSRLFNELGVAHGVRGAYRLAIADFTKAIQLDSSNYEAFYNRSYAYKQIGDSVKSEADRLEAERLKQQANDKLEAELGGSIAPVSDDLIQPDDDMPF